MNQNIICGPVSNVKRDSWINELRVKDIVLSDVGESNKVIDILIGADVAGKLITGRKHNLRNGLTAFETLLGWTVIGKVPRETKRSDTALIITTMFVQEADICDLWRLDVLGVTDPIERIDKSERDNRTRAFLIETAKLNANGRYEVRLPWSENHMPVTSNFEIAKNRLEKCLNKLKAQNLFKSYDNVFKEWLSEGIIERVPEDELNNPGHYLPHRPVIKAHSTTKIRPIFDAPACKKEYPSLNQYLEKGPNLIELVPSSLNRFRERAIGVVSDIKRAFLQIVINKEDRDFLRFFWVEDGKIIIFRHCRVVFGLTCSPFILAAIIELHLSTYLKGACEMKESIKRLKESFYVDNCVSSVDSTDKLKTFVSEATTVMKRGGFELRGWESSYDATENRETPVLDIMWYKERDTIAINPTMLNINISENVTKRTILSAAHKIFDPIGFTCPTSVMLKILLKELWIEKIGWDTKITDKQADKFRSWLNDLPALIKIEIPRKLERGDLTLHTFCDASGTAYAAAVFARIEHEGNVSVRLLSARTRIAPDKATISRLELMAAVIAVRLTSSVIESLTRKVLKTTFWSDSTTVLAWINRDLQWGTFVWNRVKEFDHLRNRTNGDMYPET